MTTTPWDKFYWADWQTDAPLKLCSFAAQGLWMRILCVCAHADPKGYLTVSGKPLSVDDMAALFGKSAEEIEPLLAELAKWEVFSKDKAGKIYNRKMVRGAKKAKTARENGKKGGNPTLSKQTDISPSVNQTSTKSEPVTSTNAPGSNQKLEARNQKLDKPPPPEKPSAPEDTEPPHGGGRVVDGEGGSETQDDDGTAADNLDNVAGDAQDYDEDPFAIPAFLKRDEDGNLPDLGEPQAQELHSRPNLANQFEPAPLPDHHGKPVCEAYLAAITEVYGNEHLITHAGHGASMIAEQWLGMGHALPEIIEVFRDVLEKRRVDGEQPPTSLNYFKSIIPREIAKAKRPSTDGGFGKGGGQAVGLHPDAEASQWRGRVKGFQESGFWMGSYGPNPGELGCECPAAILQEFGYGLAPAAAEGGV